MADALRIGEVAALTGLTVRSLHHYDALGLLRPTLRSDAGHRFYTGSDMSRLLQIILLKDLGFPLGDIKNWLENPTHSPEAAIGMQRERIARQIVALQQICDDLDAVYKKIQSSPELSMEEITKLMEVIRLKDKYYTTEQREYLDKRAQELGPQLIKSVEQEWPELIARVQNAMDRGVAANSPEAAALGKRWGELIELFTGGDDGIYQSLSRYYQNEPAQAHKMGIDDKVWIFIRDAMAAMNSANTSPDE